MCAITQPLLTILLCSSNCSYTCAQSDGNHCRQQLWFNIIITRTTLQIRKATNSPQDSISLYHHNTRTAAADNMNWIWNILKSERKKIHGSLLIEFICLFEVWVSCKHLDYFEHWKSQKHKKLEDFFLHFTLAILKYTIYKIFMTSHSFCKYYISTIHVQPVTNAVNKFIQFLKNIIAISKHLSKTLIVLLFITL